MSSPLLFGLVYLAAFSIRLTRAQFSNITCTSQHAWLSVPCVGETAAVDSGEYYDGPLFGPDNCLCNTVMYSVVEACQLCQFDVSGGPQAWSVWSRNCTTTTVGSVFGSEHTRCATDTRWRYSRAYLDVVKADRFNETGTLGGSRKCPGVDGGFEHLVDVDNTYSHLLDRLCNVTICRDQYHVEPADSHRCRCSSGSNSNHSDPKGPQVGGLVGGVLGFLLIGALIFYILLRHRRPTGAAHAQPDAGQAALSAEGTISRSGTPGPYGHPAPLKERMMSQTDPVVYDLDGPRTFPPQMGMAAMGGSVDGHMREMTVASEGYEMREI